MKSVWTSPGIHALGHEPGAKFGSLFFLSAIPSKYEFAKSFSLRNNVIFFKGVTKKYANGCQYFVKN